MRKTTQTITLEPPDRDIPTMALTTEEAAKALGIGEKSVLDLVKAKKIRPVRIGNKFIFGLSEINRFLDSEAS